MKIFDLEFDEDYCVGVYISEQENEILLYLSDSLAVIEELPNKPEDYKKSILNLLSKSYEWYSKAIERITNELINEKSIKLVCIYILTEPNEKPLTFGLQFRVSSDIEHGRGMKIETDNMDIIDYGLADVAFC